VTSAPAAFRGPHEIGRLAGHVQTGPDAQTGERPLDGEALADQAQDRHLPLRPLDAADTFGRAAEVGHVMGWRGAGSGGSGHGEGGSLRGLK